MERVIIETRNLTKQYGDKTAVNQLNLTVRRGEIFGLLGPNGAGKTTTILMLLGLTEPTDGQAFIDGRDCTREPIDVKRMVGYMPDNVGFYSDMTGRENLRFTGKLNGLPDDVLEERIERLLKRVGMEDAADQKAGTYSRGMRQRLGIADVLMKDPQVIIMDEPTLGIDPEGMRELLELMKELSQKDGRTLLISSHQLYQIQQICDRVGIFVDGNLIACGEIEELAQQVQEANDYRLEMNIFPCDEKALAEICRQEGVLKIDKEGDTFLVRSSTDIRKAMTRYLGEHGYTILHMHQRGGDLDEIYRLYFERAGETDENSSDETKTQNHFRQLAGRRKQKK